MGYLRGQLGFRNSHRLFPFSGTFWYSVIYFFVFRASVRCPACLVQASPFVTRRIEFCSVGDLMANDKVELVLFSWLAPFFVNVPLLCITSFVGLVFFFVRYIEVTYTVHFLATSSPSFFLSHPLGNCSHFYSSPVSFLSPLPLSLFVALLGRRFPRFFPSLRLLPSLPPRSVPPTLFPICIVQPPMSSLIFFSSVSSLLIRFPIRPRTFPVFLFDSFLLSSAPSWFNLSCRRVRLHPVTS